MPRRTKAEAQATRASLLDAAERLFQARGVSRTSLQQIADAAGVTRGAVYWHFRDKVDLFAAMMDRAQLPLEEPPAPHEGTRSSAASAAMVALREQLVRTLALIAGDARVRGLLEIALHKVEFVDELAAVRERHHQAMDEHRAAIERCLRRAGRPAATVTDEALGLNALVAGLIHAWMLAPGSFDLVARGRSAIDIYLAGLAPPSAPAAPQRRQRSRR